METGTKNRCVIDATHVVHARVKAYERLNLELFGNVSVHDILSRESVDYFGASEHY